MKKAAENTVRKVSILRTSLILKDREMCICIEWQYIAYAYDVQNQSQATGTFLAIITRQTILGRQSMSTEVVILEL